MKDYSKIVISIIDNDGQYFEVESSEDDVKHFSAYKRLIQKIGTDSFGIIDYIIRSNNIASVTGFEIAKFIAASGNVVFFHTDVHNAYIDIKEASIVFTKDMSPIQKLKTFELLACLQDFKLYLGYAYVSNKKKICYQRVPNEKFMSTLFNDSKEKNSNARKR